MDYKTLPKFDAPPVIETVLNAQFEPLSKFTDAHVGLYCSEFLDKSWNELNEAPKLDDLFEKFGDERKWILGRNMRFVQSGSDRTQIIRSDDLHMIQIQNSRFIKNWRKQQAQDYPSYEKLLPEFKNDFENFEKFVVDKFEQKLVLNQWELVYVNILEKGQLWNDISDMEKIFPQFRLIGGGINDQRFETFSGDWVSIIGENKGRIYINISHVRVGSTDGDEAIRLQITARGPVGDGVSLYDGFDIGHRAIVCTFADITSKLCHEYWERKV